MKKMKIKITRGDLRPRMPVIKELMGVGGPRMVEGFVNNTVILIQRIFIIMASGTVGVALFNVPFRFISLSMCPVEAMGMAAVPVIAANLGKRDVEKMRAAKRVVFKGALLISLSIVVILYLAAPLLIGVFTTEPTLYEWFDELTWNLKAYCIILPFFAVQAVCSSILQSIKKSRLPMRITMIVGVFRMIVFWTAIPYGYQGITVALILSYVLSCTFSIIAEEKYFGKSCDEVLHSESEVS